jgi:hypothetical protein
VIDFEFELGTKPKTALDAVKKMVETSSFEPSESDYKHDGKWNWKADKGDEERPLYYED